MRLNFFLILCSLLVCNTGYPCTGWGVIEEAPSGNVVLVKNRDSSPSPQQVILVKPTSLKKKFFPHIALYALNDKKKPIVRAGVNNQGVSIVSLTSGVIDKPNRARCFGDVHVLESILKNYQSVEHILQDGEKLFGFAAPVFYLIADKKNVIAVEIAPKECKASQRVPSAFSISYPSANFLTHSNHYLNPHFVSLNTKVLEGSLIRQQRIHTILSTTENKQIYERSLEIAKETLHGPDHSLFRYGPNKHTLASWIIKFPKDGSTPVLNLSLYKKTKGDPIPQTLEGIQTIQKEILLDEHAFNHFAEIKDFY